MIAACGSSSSSSGNGIASKSATEIVTSAKNALESAKSVHVSGQQAAGGQTTTVDLKIVAGKGGAGSFSQGGVSLRLVIVGKSVYIYGSIPFLKHSGGSPAAIQQLQGKWLKAPSSGSASASLSALTDLHQIAAQLVPGHGTLSKGSTSTVNGQKVIALTNPSGGRLYVATTGKPYPIVVAKTGSTSQHVDFDQYNASVALSPPAKSIDISQLQSK